MEELNELTHRLEALTERVNAAYESYGAPSHVPLVEVEGKDPDLEALAMDMQAYRDDNAALWRRHHDHVPGDD